MSDARTGKFKPGFAIGLAILALALLVLWTRGCWSLPFDDHGRSFWAPGLYGPLSIWGLLQAVLAIWVGLDANRRGLNGILWGLLVFFTGIVGLIVYLLVGPVMQRSGDDDPLTAVANVVSPRAPTPKCPGCEAEVGAGFKVCPYCGVSLACKQCGQTIAAGWRICPYCATEIDAKP